MQSKFLAERAEKYGESASIHRALNHPLRRRIIELLGEKGSMSFTDFKKTLEVRVGTLYYHFDSLNPLITQDEQKKYVLTEVGQRAYQMMRNEDQTRLQPPPKLRSSGAPTSYAKNILLPAGFLSYVYSKPRLGFVGAIALIAFGAVLSQQARLEPILFFFDRAQPALQAFIPLEFVASWIGVFLLSDVLAIGLFQRRGDDRLLLIGTAFSFTPAIIFPLVNYVASLLGLGTSLIRDPIFGRALLAVLQSWAVVVLTYAIAVSKGLRIDKAAIIGLVVAYTNILLLFVLGRIR